MQPITVLLITFATLSFYFSNKFALLQYYEYFKRVCPFKSYKRATFMTGRYAMHHTIVVRQNPRRCRGNRLSTTCHHLLAIACHHLRSLHLYTFRIEIDRHDAKNPCFFSMPKTTHNRIGFRQHLRMASRSTKPPWPRNLPKRDTHAMRRGNGCVMDRAAMRSTHEC